MGESETVALLCGRCDRPMAPDGCCGLGVEQRTHDIERKLRALRDGLRPGPARSDEIGDVWIRGSLIYEGEPDEERTYVVQNVGGSEGELLFDDGEWRDDFALMEEGFVRQEASSGAGRSSRAQPDAVAAAIRERDQAREDRDAARAEAEHWRERFEDLETSRAVCCWKNEQRADEAEAQLALAMHWGRELVEHHEEHHAKELRWQARHREVVVERDEARDEVERLGAMACDDCDGSGTYTIKPDGGEPRVEVCICVSETAPYQALEAEVERLEGELAGAEDEVAGTHERLAWLALAFRYLRDALRDQLVYLPAATRAQLAPTLRTVDRALAAADTTKGGAHAPDRSNARLDRDERGVSPGALPEATVSGHDDADGVAPPENGALTYAAAILRDVAALEQPAQVPPVPPLDRETLLAAAAIVEGLHGPGDDRG